MYKTYFLFEKIILKQYHFTVLGLETSEEITREKPLSANVDIEWSMGCNKAKNPVCHPDFARLKSKFRTAHGRDTGKWKNSTQVGTIWDSFPKRD